MAHRVNVMLNDEAWKFVQELPRGQRSTFISRAVVDAATRDARRRAAAELARLRENMAPPPASAEEMIRELRDHA